MAHTEYGDCICTATGIIIQVTLFRIPNHMSYSAPFHLDVYRPVPRVYQMVFFVDPSVVHDVH